MLKQVFSSLLRRSNCPSLKHFSTCPVLRDDSEEPALGAPKPLSGAARYVPGKTKGKITATKLRGALVDESGDIQANIEALEDSVNRDFQLYPDENTAEKLFNGVKFKDLPYVTIRCTFNNTRFWVNKADGEMVYYTSPALNGFLNAKKRTAVAAQATGHTVGQKLRLFNMRTVRVRIDGFNAARLSAVKGLVQSGTNVVCVSDITTVDWHWAQRAKKPKRKN